MQFIDNAFPRLPRLSALTLAVLAAAGLSSSAAIAGPLNKHRARTSHAQVEAFNSQVVRALAAYAGTPRHPTAGTVHQIGSCLDDGGPTTLRAIIANMQTVSGDTIDLAHLPMGCSTITLGSSGAITIAQDRLYIEGPVGSTVTIDGDNSSNVLLHTGTDALYLSNLTIANGKYDGSMQTHPGGACIRSDGSISLVKSVVDHCVLSNTSGASTRGGGVYSAGNLTLVRSTIRDSHFLSKDGNGAGAYALGNFVAMASTISGNSAFTNGGGATYGGGISVRGNLSDIESSTISGNAATYYGAAEMNSGVVVNTTVSSNYAVGAYGGIMAFGPLTLTNSTIAFNQSRNSSSAGNGVWSVQLTSHSSIIADNSGPLGSTDLGGFAAAFIDGTDNLIVSSAIAVPLGNIIGTCPRLDVLTNNGGLTQTNALHAASPAIDQGHPDNLQNDQRGQPRTSGVATDIGAFERQPTDTTERLMASGFDGFCDQ